MGKGFEPARGGRGAGGCGEGRDMGTTEAMGRKGEVVAAAVQGTNLG